MFLSLSLSYLHVESGGLRAAWDAELHGGPFLKDWMVSVAAVLYCWVNPCCQLAGGILLG